MTGDQTETIANWPADKVAAGDTKEFLESMAPYVYLSELRDMILPLSSVRLVRKDSK